MNKKIVLTLIILLPIIIAAFFITRNYSLSKTVFNPTYIPPNYTPIENYQIQRNGTKEIIVIEYSHPTRGEIIFSQQTDPTFECIGPQSKSELFSNYQTYQLNNKSNSCAITLTKPDGNSDRLFTWRNENTKFSIKAINLSIDDVEFQKIANSLVPSTTYFLAIINQ